MKISTVWNSQDIPKHDPQSIFIFEMELKEFCIASFKGGYIWCTQPLFCRNSSFYFVHIQLLHIFSQQTFKYGNPEGCDTLKDVGKGKTLHLAPRWMRPKLFCTTKKVGSYTGALRMGVMYSTQDRGLWWPLSNVIIHLIQA